MDSEIKEFASYSSSVSKQIKKLDDVQFNSNSDVSRNSAVDHNK